MAGVLLAAGDRAEMRVNHLYQGKYNPQPTLSCLGEAARARGSEDLQGKGDKRKIASSIFSEQLYHSLSRGGNCCLALDNFNQCFTGVFLESAASGVM